MEELALIRGGGPPPVRCPGQVAKALPFLGDPETGQGSEASSRTSLGALGPSFSKAALGRVLTCRLVSQELKRERAGGLP